MNLLDAYVTEVTGPPENKFNAWFVPVKYNCWGKIDETVVICQTEEEAKKVDVGHHFMT